MNHLGHEILKAKQYIECLKAINIYIIPNGELEHFFKKVQNAVARGEIKDVVSLRNNARIEYSMYNQILECREDGFEMAQDGKFHCEVFLRSSFAEEEKKIEFTERTTPHDFKL